MDQKDYLAYCKLFHLPSLKILTLDKLRSLVIPTRLLRPLIFYPLQKNAVPNSLTLRDCAVMAKSLSQALHANLFVCRLLKAPLSSTKHFLWDFCSDKDPIPVRLFEKHGRCIKVGDCPAAV